MASVRTIQTTEPAPEAEQLPDAKQTAETVALVTHADLSKQQKDETNLMFALRQGNVDQAIKLLDRESNLDRTDAKGWSAVMYAAYYGHYNVLKKLVGRGADLNIMSSDGHVALSLALYRRQKAIALGDSATKQVSEEIVCILIECKANINIIIDGISLLSQAISNRDDQLILLLLRYNARIFDQDALRSFLRSCSQLDPRVFFCFQKLYEQHENPVDQAQLKFLSVINSIENRNFHDIKFFNRYTTVRLTSKNAAELAKLKPKRLVCFDLDDTGIDLSASEKKGEPVVLNRSELDEILDTENCIFICITKRPFDLNQLIGKLSALNLLRAVSDKFSLLMFTDGLSKVFALNDLCEFFEVPPSAVCLLDDLKLNICEVSRAGIVALPVSQKPYSMYGEMFQRFITTDLRTDPTYGLFLNAWVQVMHLINNPDYDYSVSLKDLQNPQTPIRIQLEKARNHIDKLKDLKCYERFYKEANEILQAYQTMLDDLTVKSTKASAQEEIKSDAPIKRTSTSSTCIAKRLGNLTPVVLSFLDPVDLVKMKRVSPEYKKIAEESICFTRANFIFFGKNQMLRDGNHLSAKQAIPFPLQWAITPPTSHRHS